MQPNNAIIGNNAVDLPIAQPDPELIREEQKIAKYSRTEEFRRLADYMRDRISFYQSYLPGGVSVESLPPDEAQKMWGPANTIIREFQAVIDFYETTASTVKESNESK